MTAAVKAVLEQAKLLTAEERGELVEELLEIDAGADPLAMSKAEIDRQLAIGIEQVRRGEVVDGDGLLAELERE